MHSGRRATRGSLIVVVLVVAILVAVSAMGSRTVSEVASVLPSSRPAPSGSQPPITTTALPAGV
ncbi:MAG: hypothetical protein ACRDRL_15825, partial [Sciscionella sp.]